MKTNASSRQIFLQQLLKKRLDITLQPSVKSWVAHFQRLPFRFGQGQQPLCNVRAKWTCTRVMLFIGDNKVEKEGFWSYTISEQKSYCFLVIVIEGTGRVEARVLFTEAEIGHDLFRTNLAAMITSTVGVANALFMREVKFKVVVID